MVALGLTAVYVWNIGALLTESKFIMHRLPQVALGLLAGYVATILFVSDRFIVGIAMYLPSAVFLLGAMSVAHVRDPKRGWAIGIVGLALTFVAAAVQQLRVALHPVWFDHNALFHLIQAVALLLLFRAQGRVQREQQASSV
jgi:sugar phosphate permease